jgi:Predicted transcriptional regulators
VDTILSKKLRKFRENSGYTQQQVADALNIDRSTYSYYELGKTTPDIHTLIALAKIFNITITDLLEESAETARVKDPSAEKRFGRKNDSFIYELSKDEKQLIIYYRLLKPETQACLISHLQEMSEKEEKKDKT